MNQHIFFSTRNHIVSGLKIRSIFNAVATGMALNSSVIADILVFWCIPKKETLKSKNTAQRIYAIFFTSNLEKKVTSPFVNVITDVTLNGKMTQRESKK